MISPVENRHNPHSRWHGGRTARGRQARFGVPCFLRGASALLLVILAGSTVFGHPGRPMPSIEPAELIPTRESDATFQRLNLMIESSLNEVERDLILDARDGKFDHYTLLDAALVASGVHDPAIHARYQRQFDAWVEKLDDQLHRQHRHKASPEIVARYIFEYMHREILTGGYSLHATNLSSVFEEGRFNCVSATLLYCCLASEFGLDMRGLETVGHAMSCLVLPKDRIEIESTCPHWFQLASDPKRRAELVEKTIGIRPDATGKGYRLVSEVELIATIYYNRGLDMLSESNFAGALAANATALALDPSNQTAHGNLLAVLNNWAIALASSGEYLEAIGLLEAGIRVDSKFTTFHTNILHVHRRWVEELCKDFRYGEAIDVLAEGSRRWPNEPWFQTYSDRLLREIGIEETTYVSQ